jgi:hypothetical protein
MKYLFLAYGDEKRLAAMPASERHALGSECRANDELLRRRGHLLAVQGLQDSRTATTVRLQNGKVVVTDGPYAETKEQILGIFTIDARDLNQAIQVASNMPQARGGPIEVRPIVELDYGKPRSRLCWQMIKLASNRLEADQQSAWGLLHDLEMSGKEQDRMNTQQSRLPDAQSGSDKEISALYRQLLGAWNKRNAAEFAALFAEDGNVVGFDGSQVDGRAEIEAHLGRIFADHPTAA